MRSIKQDQINLLIVKYAYEYGHVVRLKGGDPFVFGRGHEEIEYVENFGISTEIIPGITSAISVPALQGIPVTRRGISESFWVITGSTKSGKLSRDIELAAQSTATIVVLMGMKNLHEIVAIYKRLGMSETPVGIIQNGSTSKEATGFGTMENILDAIRRLSEGIQHEEERIQYLHCPKSSRPCWRCCFLGNFVSR